jgi:hypothetical protein
MLAPFRRRVAPALLVGLLGLVPVAASAQQVTEVEVERVKPRKESHPTLQFLKANRDFIRGRFDLLREKTRTRKTDGSTIDPRFLAYQDMLAAIHAAKDTMVVATGRQQRLELLASITELGDLDARLDLMERLLEEQRGRLGVIEDHFAGDQQTALMVVVTGHPAEAVLTGVGITLDDRAAQSVSLLPDQTNSLRRGGSVEVFHGFVEPREQVVKISVSGNRWPTGVAGYATLQPTRDRITLLRLDLSAMDAGRDATSIQASTWLHPAGTPTGDR